MTRNVDDRDLPVTVAQWRAYLAGYSADYLRVADERRRSGIAPEQRAAGWLGFPAATPAQVVALEERLGTRLPPSYRSFLLTTDGWLHLGPFMWSMRTTRTVGWLRDVEPGLANLPDEVPELADDPWWEIPRRSLAISAEGDAQYWFLDPEEIGADGEWTAHTWSDWGLDRSYPSFAALVAAQRNSFEELAGRDGRPVRPEGADELTAEGRRLALRGEVEAARALLGAAVRKGSGVAAYLNTLLGAFLDPPYAVHSAIRNDVLAGPVRRGEIDLTHLRAELVPLYLTLSREDGHSPRWYLPQLADALPELDGTGDDEDGWRARESAFVPPVLPETPVFTQALDQARALAAAGATDDAWAAIARALPEWDSSSPLRIAPVILLTDPTLRALVTPDRSRMIVTTPRGAERATGNGR